MSATVLRYVIIGNSAAGVSAAEAIREADPRGEITILSDEDRQAYSRIFLPDLIAGKIDFGRMTMRRPDFYARLGIDLRLGQAATRVDVRERRVELVGGGSLGYDRLLLATGALPVPVDVSGSDLLGVTGLHSYEDAMVILGRTRDRASGGGSGQVVVVGGGPVSIKTAEALHKLGQKVVMVVSSPAIMSRTADAVAAGLLSRRMEEAGVRLLTGRNVTAVQGDRDGGVKAVVLDSGETVQASVVAVGKGVRPNLSLAAGAGLKCGRGILVNERLETEAPGVYAAGDVAETPVGQRTVVNTMWPNAVAQGRTAGRNMAGATEVGPVSIRSNAGTFFGLTLATVGQTETGPNQTEVVRGDGSAAAGGQYRKVILDEKGALVGAVLVGRVDSVGFLRWTLSQGTSVAPLRPHLMDFGLRYSAVLAQAPGRAG
ncbi:MAG: NAD(P)/FAD-dependent oxidoreductase [Bacillota bacterium]